MCTILPTKYQLTTDPPYAATDKQTAGCILRLQPVNFESKHGSYHITVLQSTEIVVNVNSDIKCQHSLLHIPNNFTY